MTVATKIYKTYFPVVKSTTYRVVWPIGDSITLGFDGHDYRSILQSLHPEIRYVGSVNTNGLWHDGHGGFRSDELLKNLPNFYKVIKEKPNYIILHVGTNNILQNRIYDITALINKIRLYLPDVYIYVARIIQFDPSHPSVNVFNPIVFQYNKEKVDTLKNVKFVNLENLLTVGDYFRDGIHPNLKGFVKIANKFSQDIFK